MNFMIKKFSKVNNKRDKYIKLRINVLKIFTNYVKKTNRLSMKFDYNYKPI